MKKVTIAAVGKIKEKYLADGIAEYQKRLGRFCRLKIIELPDLPCEPGTVARESEAVVKVVDRIDFLMDSKGEPLSSEELSRAIEDVYLRGGDEAVFVLGGSGGVDNRVREKAARIVSFGRATFPHQLMRLMLLEQIYRAFTISGNLPYHK